MGRIGIATALVLLGLVLASCGDDSPSERDREGGRAGKEAFALAKLACGEEPRADFAVSSVGLPASAGNVAVAHAYAGQWPPGLAKAVFRGCMAGLATVPDRAPPSSPLARDLWGRNFVATAVVGSEGSDPPVHQPPEIRIAFSSEGYHAISWTARCNSFGGAVRITATKLEVEQAGGTLIGCPDGRHEEDQWLSGFMESGPEWDLQGGKLRLVTASAEIELVEQGPE